MGMMAEKQVAGMFHRVNDFAFARNEKQAVGFYLFHLLVAVVGLAMAVLVYGLVFGFDNFAAAETKSESLRNFQRAIVWVQMGYVGYLVFHLLSAKNRLRDFRAAAAGVLAVVLTAAGLILGMLVVACLSILRPKVAIAADGAGEKGE